MISSAKKLFYNIITDLVLKIFLFNKIPKIVIDFGLS